MRPLLTTPAAPLAAFSLATAAFLCAFVAMRRPPTTGAEMVLALGWGLMLLLWADADARRRRRVPCFDFGLLAAVFFPVSVAWYCVWSRGWGRGLLLLLALFGLWLVPRILAVLFWMVLRVMP